MNIIREKTLFFNFKESNICPSELEIHRWLRSLDIQDGDLRVIDFHFHTKHVVVKFNDQENLENFIEKYGHSVHFDSNGVDHLIPVSIAGSRRKAVKVKFIPDEMDLNDVTSCLSKYGQIKKTTWEEPTQFSKDLFKVKRERITVDMVVTKNIPSFITVNGIKLNVNYQGQLKTCSKCESTTHVAKVCNATNLNFSSAVKSNNYGGNITHSETLAKAINDLEELVIEAENINENNEKKKRKNSKEIQTEKSNSNNWIQVTKKGRKGSKNNESQNEGNSESDMETSSELENEEDFIDIESAREGETKKQKNTKKPRKVIFSKEFKDSRKKSFKSNLEETNENPEEHASGQSKHNSLYYKTKTILRNKKIYKPILIQRKPKNTNNGTSGFPWPESSTQTRSNENTNNPENNHATQNVETTDQDQNHSKNFYDDILTPILT